LGHVEDKVVVFKASEVVVVAVPEPVQRKIDRESPKSKQQMERRTRIQMPLSDRST